MSTPSLDDLLSVAVEAAYLGGRRTLAYFNTGVVVESKADATPVTRADREAEEIIRARIARTFPSHSILGEEGGAHAGDPDYLWIIDPLDGTKSFIHGVPLYGVLIGVEVRGEPAVGVAYLPALDEMVAAGIGLGCRWNGRPTRVSGVVRLEEATLLANNPLSAMARSDAYERLASRTKLQRGWGDLYGYVLVATGRAEIMLDYRMNLWDAAALIPILHEAGGRFTDWKGVRTPRHGEGVGTNAALHDQVIAILRDERRKDSGVDSVVSAGSA